MSERFRVASQRRVQTVLDRLARQVHATLPDEFAIIGVRRRGVPLAAQLSERLESLRGRRVPVGEVSVKRYADDLSMLHETPRLDVSKSDSPADLRGRTVLLVDDVLFSGHTLLRVLQWLSESEPAAVRTAVLCARDTQEFPLHADFVGMQLDVGPRGKIDVDAPPYESDWAVWLSHTNPSIRNL